MGEARVMKMAKFTNREYGHRRSLRDSSNQGSVCDEIFASHTRHITHRENFSHMCDITQNSGLQLSAKDQYLSIFFD